MSPAGGVEREDGPLHDPERRVFDSTYSDGSWDTLTFFPDDCMVLLGLSAKPFDLKHKDGAKQRLQGGMYTMVRGRSRAYVMTIGGGD